MSRTARSRLLVPFAVGTLLLGLAACGGDDEEPTATPSGSASTSPTAAASNPNAGPPPTDLVLKVLKAGTGATVAAGDSVTIDYQGTNWTSGSIFDQSYGREPATFTTDGVVPGFGAALVGQKVGSQVVVAIPPEFGYGSAGQPSAGIAGTDTLVFVIDIKKTVRNTTQYCNAPGGAASKAVKVSGTFGEKATPTFAKPLKAAKLQRTIAKAGQGKATRAGDNVSILLSIYNGRTGAEIDMSPGTLKVGDPQIPAPIQAGLSCVKVGSRVVSVFPAKDVPSAVDGTTIKNGDSLVLVTDVIKIEAAQQPVAAPKPKAWTNPPTVKFNGSEPPTLTLPKS